MLFFHEEEADSGEEGYVEQVSLLLSVNPNDTGQEPFRLGSNEIRPEPVINGMLFDETVNGTSIRGEIGGVSVGVFEEPEQIVGEFWGHVVDVNPKGKGHRVVRIREEPVHLGVKNGVVELLRHVVVLGFVAGRCVVVFEGRLSVGEEEVVEGGQERGFGIGNVEMLRGRRGAERREREEE